MNRPDPPPSAVKELTDFYMNEYIQEWRAGGVTPAAEDIEAAAQDALEQAWAAYEAQQNPPDLPPPAAPAAAPVRPGGQSTLISPTKTAQDPTLGRAEYDLFGDGIPD